jgi:hypothetical protein
MQIAAYKTDTLLYMSKPTKPATLPLTVKAICISSLETMRN